MKNHLLTLEQWKQLKCIKDSWKRLPIYSFHMQEVSTLHKCGKKSLGWKQTSIHSLVFIEKLCYQLLLRLMDAFEIRKIWHQGIIYTSTMVLPDAVLQAPAIYDDQRTKMMLSYGKFKSYQKKWILKIEQSLIFLLHLNETVRTMYVVRWWNKRNSKLNRYVREESKTLGVLVRPENIFNGNVTLSRATVGNGYQWTHNLVKIKTVYVSFEK